MRLILILLIVMPILEIWVLIQVGGVIGALPTVALVILTAAVGIALLRRQGISTLLRVREKLERGEVPASEMAEGVFLAVGGLLLLLPGFITDCLGFCCLIPGLRRGLIEWGLRHSVVHKRSGATDSHTIEGEYHREDEPRK